MNRTVIRSNSPKSKCSFCSYYVGNECTAAKSAGQVNSYYCKQAQYEYRQWLDKQQLNQRKSNNRRY